VAETFPYVCVAFSGFHLNGITNQFIQTGQQFPSRSPSLAFERVHTDIMIPSIFVSTNIQTAQDGTETGILASPDLSDPALLQTVHGDLSSS
jgi:hypothetical protein